MQKMCRNSMQKRTAWSLLSACNLGSQRVKHWTAGKTKTGACIRYNARKLSEAQNMQWRELPLTSLMICLWISELFSDPLALIVQRNVLAIKGKKQCELKNIKGLWENNFDWRKKQTLMSFFFTSVLPRLHVRTSSRSKPSGHSQLNEPFVLTHVEPLGQGSCFCLHSSISKHTGVTILYLGRISPNFYTLITLSKKGLMQHFMHFVFWKTKHGKTHIVPILFLNCWVEEQKSSPSLQVSPVHPCWQPHLNSSGSSPIQFPSLLQGLGTQGFPKIYEWIEGVLALIRENSILKKASVWPFRACGFTLTCHPSSYVQFYLCYAKSIIFDRWFFETSTTNFHIFLLL